MGEKSTIGEFYLDNLSDCPENDSGSDSDNESGGSDIVTRKESNSDNDEDNDDLWSIYDEAVVLEPFQGSPGMKITPSSPENLMDSVDLFIANDFFEHLVMESNRYHYQLVRKYKTPSKAKKWIDITVPEMKKFLGLILLMGQVKKDVLYEYWSTDPSIETPFFSEVMSRNRFVQIMQSWHFCNNETISNKSHRLAKIQPIIDYFKQKFNDVYKPCQQLALDECIIPWRGRLSVKTNNSARHGIQVRVLCEAVTGYVCNFHVCASNETKSKDNVMETVTKPYKNVWHHIYHEYYSVEMAKTLLKNKIRVCGKIRNNVNSLRCKRLSKGQREFRRNNQVLLEVWNDGKRNVNMISTIHSAQLMETKSKNKTQKPNSLVDYNRYMKSVDRADQYLSYYSIFRKTKKWTKRVVMFLINCALFDSFKIYTILNGRKITFKNYLHKVAVSWIGNCGGAEQDNDELDGNLEPTKRTPRFDHPGRLENFGKHKLVRIVVGGESVKPQRQCRVCAAKKKRSRTCFVCKFCNVPLHKGDCFERYHTLKIY